MDALFFHPKVVHIPIALSVLMPFIAGALALAWWRGWLPGRAWWLAVALQAILFGSGFVAMRAGHAEEERVERVVPERAIHAHEEAGEVFVWTSGGLLALMLLAGALGKRRAGLALAWVATLGTIVVLGLGYRTGQAGGRLVYEDGAARAYTAGAPAPPAAGARGDDDD